MGRISSSLRNLIGALQESDENLRQLERAAKSGSPEDMLPYLAAMKRAGKPIDLVAVGTDKKLLALLRLLAKNSRLDLIFNKNYPFSGSDQGVRILAAAMKFVRDKKVPGLQWPSFYVYLNKWLQSAGRRSKHGRSLGNTPIENYIQRSVEDSIERPHGGWIGYAQSLELPSADDAVMIGMSYGDLMDIALNIKGGAVIVVRDDGVVQTSQLFPTERAAARAWSDLVDDNEADVNEVRAEIRADSIRHWAREFDVYPATLARILGETDIFDEDPEDWSRADIQHAIDEYIVDVADQQARVRYKALGLGVNQHQVSKALELAMRNDTLPMEPEEWEPEDVAEVWRAYNE